MKIIINLAVVVFFTAIVPFGSPTASHSASVDIELQKANQRYSQGNYDDAIAIYRQIIAEHGFSAELLHNLANSYAAAGKNGLAVLNYLRGLRVSPGDDDLIGDLDRVRKDIGLFTEEPDLIEKLITVFDLNQWSMLALSGYVLLCLLCLLHYWQKEARWLRPFMLLSGALICFSLFGAYHQRTLWHGGVIISPQTSLLMSPFASSSSLGTIDEGTIVYEEKKHGEYHYVRDLRGRAGWVDSSFFQKINTSHLTYSQGGAAQ